MSHTTIQDDGWSPVGADQTSSVGVSPLSIDVDVGWSTPSQRAAARHMLLVHLQWSEQQSSQRSDDVPQTPKVPRDNDRSPASDAVPQSMQENWPQLSASKLLPKTYARILRLAQDATATPGSAGLRPESLRAFLAFWSAVRDVAPAPEITLARNGSLVAVWHRDSRRHIDVIFKPDGMVLYGIFIGRIVNEGRDTVEGLARILTAKIKWPT